MNQRIGYARISSDDQHLDLQRDAFMRAGCGAIYEEAASGKSAARPELELCRKALRAGDTLVVWRLDRLGRSLPDLVQIVADLGGNERQKLERVHGCLLNFSNHTLLRRPLVMDLVLII